MREFPSVSSEFVGICARLGSVKTATQHVFDALMSSTSSGVDPGAPPLAPHLAPLGHASGHNQLDRPTLVALRGHGLAQRFHGVLVGLPQQRLPVDGDQLVVDAETAVLRRKRQT